MKHILPETMTAVGLDESGIRLVTRSVPVPTPARGEVLVRMSASPINPSDLARIRHLPQQERIKFIGGIEGCGTVVDRGKGLLPSIWMGRRVACSSTHTSSGTWAGYMVTSGMACIPLPDEISDEQGAMLLVNPLTAVAFLKIARAGNHKAIINTAAAGALGRMIGLLAKKHGKPVIQIVRNIRQKASLLSGGAEYVLDSSSVTFKDDLCALSLKLNASLAFDAVGGEMTQHLLTSLPYGGHVIVYGNLSGEQPLADHRSLVTGKKDMSGFYLVNWLREHGMINTLSCIIEARRMLSKEITIPVQAKFPLENAQQAVDTYMANMTAGKVLLIR